MKTIYLMFWAIFLLGSGGQAAYAESTIFDNGNIAGVYNNPTAATVFTVTNPVTITYVLTYHWNSGRGSTVGTIGLKHSDGTMYGPWQAVSTAGNNLYWEVHPATTIKAGTYTVIDSTPSTWSYNSQSGNAGITIIKGDIAATYTISTAASPTAGGSVACSPNPVTSGGSSTCTATANSGYTFSAWSGNCSGTASTCTLSNVTEQKSAVATFSASTTATPEPITLDELAAMFPEYFDDGLYPVILGQEPLGISGLSLLNTKASFIGDTLRIENIISGKTQHMTVDWTLRSGLSGYSFDLTNITAGYPNPLVKSPLPGIDSSGSSAYLYGPPLGISIIPLRVGSDYYAVTLAFSQSNNGFKVSAIDKLANKAFYDKYWGTQTAFAPISRAASSAIDKWINEQTKVEISLPSSSDLQAALLDCGRKLAGNLEFDSYAANVAAKLASNSDVVQEGIENLAEGQTAEASLLFSKAIGKALIESVSDPKELTRLAQKISEKSGYVDATAPALGSSCGGDYKQALKTLVAGVFNEVLPLTSCGLGVYVESARKVNEWVNDDLVMTHYQSWKAQDGLVANTGAGSFELLSHVAKIRGISTDEADRQLVAQYQKWQAAEGQAPARKARLNDIYARYLQLSVGQMDNLRKRSGGASATEVDLFRKYIEIEQQSRNALAPYLSKSAVDAAVQSVAKTHLDSGRNSSSYKNFVATLIGNGSSTPTFTEVPTYCKTSASTGGSSKSGTAEWGQYHLKYTISGANLVDPPEYTAPFGYDIYTYSGKLSGSTLSISGTGWVEQASAADDDFNYVVYATVSVGANSKTYTYTAPKGEILNKSFALSVPIPAGATTGSFTMRVDYYNSNYGPRGVVVGGSLK